MVVSIVASFQIRFISFCSILYFLKLIRIARNPLGNANSTIVSDVCNDLISSVSLTLEIATLVNGTTKFTRVRQNDSLNLTITQNATMPFDVYAISL